MNDFILWTIILVERQSRLRLKNLDKRREKEYWTLPEEEKARAFEVYLRENLKERGIQKLGRIMGKGD